MMSSTGNALADVVIERQIVEEGYDEKHDSDHTDSELAQAAAAYALQAAGRNDLALDNWPWDSESFKPKDRRSNLVRAAALILAEIERLDRL